MTSYHRREFLKTVAAGAAGFSILPWMHTCSWPADRPNILLIMADDMGYSDIGCYGGEIETPNLDKLAVNGMRFTQFYNNAKCAPTRASLLTGLYSQQVGIDSGPRKMQNCVTVAEVLKSAGYRTLMTGKWHAAEIPTDRGFDRYFGLADGCCNFFNPGEPRQGEPAPVHKTFPRRWAIDEEVYQPYTPEDPDFYTTDAFTDYALEYLEEYKGEENPFFLYLAYTAPHYPLHAWPEDIAKYRGKYLKGWDELREERFRRMVDMGLIKEEWGLSPRDDRVPAWEDLEDESKWALKEIQDHTRGEFTGEQATDRDLWDLKMAVYAAMVDRMDQNIGRVLDKLEEQGELENTLILFLSDNGGCAELVHISPGRPPGTVDSYRTVDPPWANAQNTPFRKYKRWDHEGGIATPLIAHWPGRVEPGTITHQVGHIIDVMATCVDIGGAEYPANYAGREVLPLQGKSLLPILEGGEREGHEVIFWDFGRTKAVRSGKWKAVQVDENPWELYDMENDRVEMHNLAGSEPELVENLAKQWNVWAKESHVSV